MQLPRYLPLATALFGVLIFAVSHIPFVQRMMAITDPVLRRPDADHDPPVASCRRSRSRKASTPASTSSS